MSCLGNSEQTPNLHFNTLTFSKKLFCVPYTSFLISKGGEWATCKTEEGNRIHLRKLGGERLQMVLATADLLAALLQQIYYYLTIHLFTWVAVFLMTIEYQTFQQFYKKASWTIYSRYTGQLHRTQFPVLWFLKTFISYNQSSCSANPYVVPSKRIPKYIHPTLVFGLLRSQQQPIE